MKVKRLIIFRIGSLGDTVIAVPAMRLIRKEYPSAKITLLTNSPVNGSIKAASSYKVLNGSGLIDDYIEYPHRSSNLKDLFKLAKSIISLKPEMLIYLMPVRSFQQRLRDYIFFLLMGITKSKGLWSKKNSRYNILNINNNTYESEGSRLIRSIGLSSEKIKVSDLSINVKSEELDFINELLKEFNEEKFISLSLGTKIDVNDWGDENWEEMLNKLSKNYSQYKLMFIGSPDEFERCNYLLSSWKNGGVNLCGKLNPRQSAAALSKSILYVGHDSGPIHLANSVGIPTIGIFSSRNKKGIWFPYSNEKNIIYTNIACSGCQLETCVEQEKKCIKSIRPNHVVDRIHNLLNENK